MDGGEMAESGGFVGVGSDSGCGGDMGESAGCGGDGIDAKQSNTFLQAAIINKVRKIDNSTSKIVRFLILL